MKCTSCNRNNNSNMLLDVFIVLVRIRARCEEKCAHICLSFVGLFWQPAGNLVIKLSHMSVG
jgi:hypothetical protein